MSEDESKPGNVSDSINAAANLAKAVPIYDDALKPIAVEAGKALGVVGRAVNVALLPIKGFVWGAEQVEEWLATRVSTKLRNVQEEDIVTPDLSVAGPTIEALKFSGHKPELSEMFANLLAGAMNKKMASYAHPAFVEKIKMMSSFDAQLFATVANKTSAPTIEIRRRIDGIEGDAIVHSFCNPELLEIAQSFGFEGGTAYEKVQSGVENLVGLGLISANDNGQLTEPEHQKAYEQYEEHDSFRAFTEIDRGNGETIALKRSYLLTTQMGKDFAKIALAKTD